MIMFSVDDARDICREVKNENEVVCSKRCE